VSQEDDLFSILSSDSTPQNQLNQNEDDIDTKKYEWPIAYMGCIRSHTCRRVCVRVYVCNLKPLSYCPPKQIASFKLNSPRTMWGQYRV
jgi:hypothetical protein